MLVRKASPEDFQKILDMCGDFWIHTQFNEEFDREHTLGMVEMSYDHGLLCVAGKEELYGFIAAIKSPLLGSRDAWMATELAWYVKPEYRGTLYGIQLIQLLERLCEQDRVKYLNMAFMETSMPQKVKKLYQSLGYTLQETVFTKVLNGSDNNDSGCNGGDRK